MGGIKLSIHPLFFVFGLFYAAIGKIFIFIIYTVCAVVHEMGHSFAAGALGYRLNKITLMPFGAVVTGNIDGLKFKDEIKIALAGPLLNLAIGLLFLAVWWIYPQSYAFTDVAAEACFSMALVNFLPVYPLDGGRVVMAGLAISFGQKKAQVISRVIGLIFAALLLVAFVFTLFKGINLSLLLFSLFVLFGALNKNQENNYVRVATALNTESLKRGMPYNRIALHKDASVKKMLSLLDGRAINEITVFDDEKKITTLSQEKIVKIVENGEIYAPIEKYLHV